MLKNASFFYLKVYNKDNGGGWNVFVSDFRIQKERRQSETGLLNNRLVESCLIKPEFYMRLTASRTPLSHPFRFYGRYRGEIKKNKL